jgi:hypothetical protein
MNFIKLGLFLVQSQLASEFGIQLRVRGKLSPVAILVAGCEENQLWS